MRHVISIVLAPVLGLVVYVLLGLALTRNLVLDDGWSGDGILAVLAAVGAGLAYAALLLPRLSPIGPALVGAVFLALTLWAVTDVTSFVDTVPRNLFGVDDAGLAPVAPFTAVLAVPLLATVVSRRRWRRNPHPTAAASSAPAQPPPGYQPGQPAGYPGAAPIGAPYGGPPSYAAVDQAPPPPYPVSGGPHLYGTPPPPHGYPPEPLNPDVTQRL